MSTLTLTAPRLTRADLPVADGTYLLTGDGRLIDYAARWAYGYIVGIAPVSSWRTLTPHTLYGVWRDPATGIHHVDVVRHIDALSDALAVARATHQLAIYDLRTRACIDTSAH